MEKSKIETRKLVQESEIRRYLKVSQVLLLMITCCFSSVAYAGVISGAPRLKDVGANALEFLLSIVGVIAIITLVVSGLMYFFSIGNEKRMEIAKRSAKYSVVGIVIALGGMVVIRTISSFF